MQEEEEEGVPNDVVSKLWRHKEGEHHDNDDDNDDENDDNDNDDDDEMTTADAVPLPKGYRLSQSVRELHGQHIYCVAWSSDVFTVSCPKQSGTPASEEASSHSTTTTRKANPEERKSSLSSSDDDDDDETMPQVAEPQQPAASHHSQSDIREATTTTTTTTAMGEFVEEVEMAMAMSAANTAAPSDHPPPPADDDDDDKTRTIQLRCFATCGGNNVTVYEVQCDYPSEEEEEEEEHESLKEDDAREERLQVRQAYVDVDKEETFYACAFGGRGTGSVLGHGPLGGSPPWLPTRMEKPVCDLIDLTSFDGPQLLCVAGKRGVIKVIDTVRQTLLLTLSGHGDEIYDLQFRPDDHHSSWILLSASKDESIRLWNLQTATCVAIFAGHEGHRDAVLSVSWHILGNRFLSGGMDTTVKLWSLQHDEVAQALTASYSNSQLRSSTTTTTKPPQQRRRGDSSSGQVSDKVFGTVYEQMPLFSTGALHNDYVDCVQFVGDLVLSKSIQDVIVLWKPMGNNRVQALREFTLLKCDVWYVRFQTDVDWRVLAIGNTQGEIRVWDMNGGSSFHPKQKPFASLTTMAAAASHTKAPVAATAESECSSSSSSSSSSSTANGDPTEKNAHGKKTTIQKKWNASTVRMVSFGPDGPETLIAVCDDATVWMWDATW